MKPDEEMILEELYAIKEIVIKLHFEQLNRIWTSAGPKETGLWKAIAHDASISKYVQVHSKS